MFSIMDPDHGRTARTNARLADLLVPALRAAWVLLVLALSSLAPVASWAQGTLLVSNLDASHPGALDLNSMMLGQGFTTGPAANGYSIESAVLYFSVVHGADAPVKVTIRGETGGHPASSAIAELSRSSPLGGNNSENEFLAPAGVLLQPNMKYWIVAERPNGPIQATSTQWATTDSGATVESNFGWEIVGNPSFSNYGSSGWSTTAAGALSFGIKGAVAEPPMETPLETPGPTPTPIVDIRKRVLEHNLASIGRTITATIVDHIWDRAARLERGGDTTLAMVGGRVIDAGAFAHSGNAQRRPRAIAGVLLGSAQADVHTLRADAVRTRDFERELLPDARALMGQTRLALALSGDSGAIDSLAIWGSGGFTAFESEGGDALPGFSAKGEVVSGHAGIDYRASPQLLIGVAAGHSRGEASRVLTDSEDDQDKLETELLSVYPYLSWTPAHSNQVWWGMVGHGSGEGTITEGTTRAKTDLSLRTFGVGMREASQIEAIAVAVKADAFLTEIVADSVRSGEISLGETTARTSRVRAALEGARDWALEGEATLSGAVEIGLRVDSRGAASGNGADIAGKLHYASPETGLDVTVRGSTLLAHDASGFKEWGIGMLLVYDPGVPGEGVRLTLRPSWNTPQSGVADALWNTGPSSVDRSGTSSNRGAALGLRLGYGSAVLHDRALMTVYGEAGNDSGASRIRLGTELRPTGAARFGLHVYGERQERGAGDENTLGLQLDLAF